MKIQSLLKTSLMLTMVLALTCVTVNNLLAAPPQSGSRNDPIKWAQQSTEPLKQVQQVIESKPTIGSEPTQPIAQPTGQPVFEPQPVSSQPVFDSQQTYSQPVYSEPIYSQPVYGEAVVSDCGCGQGACSSCSQAPAPAVSCGCNRSGCKLCQRPRSGCGICKRKCGGGQCPQCEGDVCKLELDKTKITKTRFTTEQKSVCVPPVRLPWMKSCPPGKSKTRLVTKLKTEKYECPHCAYKWSLVEPEEPKAPEEAEAPSAAQQPEVYQSTPVHDSYLPPNQGNQIPPTETFTPEAFTPEVTPKSLTPPQLEPAVNKPVVPKVETVVPPPPSTGSMPWRVNAPTS